ncbi:MAG: hypothetical protein QOG25_3980 [Acetobacteraceae bacterium]|nr:hypothetical protein [Acetobacteraceae bacterium]
MKSARQELLPAAHQLTISRSTRCNFGECTPSRVAAANAVVTTMHMPLSEMVCVQDNTGGDRIRKGSERTMSLSRKHHMAARADG